MSGADIEFRLDTVYAERIDSIEKITLHGKRPRSIGYNARKSTHGSRVSDPVVRLRTAGGGHGISWSRLSQDEAEGLMGRTVGELFRLPGGCTQEGRCIDLPLWAVSATAVSALRPGIPPVPTIPRRAPSSNFSTRHHAQASPSPRVSPCGLRPPSPGCTFSTRNHGTSQ